MSRITENGSLSACANKNIINAVFDDGCYVITIHHMNGNYSNVYSQMNRKPDKIRRFTYCIVPSAGSVIGFNVIGISNCGNCITMLCKPLYGDDGSCDSGMLEFINTNEFETVFHTLMNGKKFGFMESRRIINGKPVVC